ncbi:WlaTC/HtrL family glycosyltransferase [Rodentibacter heidelbergensis]|uniref:Protein YibB n=1 Tax=Rodentibacter heidelbergensis TaxID=1908258 RepID=A0A1V3I6Z7_9PAST|nr:WlaTC/HtrL family glycosyltransferase [Rodentibacter heidelbergensis]OOF35811.1 hypothetical protein BKK48_08605 [Rodentibacter heidelbergensis]
MKSNAQSIENNQIIIVTAFFDIGRGNIPKDKGYPEYLSRTTDTYFEYFSNLATLENEMVIFTSPDLKERINKIRKDKPTKVITLDIDKKFKHILNKIKAIQELDEFKNKVSPKQIKNIEYWSNYYTLVTNLKTFFVNLAIKNTLDSVEITQPQFAWVDFGYVRNMKTLDNISSWSYEFEKDKINFFSIQDIYKIRTIEDVYHAIFYNEPYIIGGCIIGNINAWKKFNRLVFNCQKNFIKNNIIDDDQGIFLMSYFNDKTFFKINELGKNNWFGLFKKFSNKKPSLIKRIMDKLKW